MKTRKGRIPDSATKDGFAVSSQNDRPILWVPTDVACESFIGVSFPVEMAVAIADRLMVVAAECAGTPEALREAIEDAGAAAHFTGGWKWGKPS